MKPKLVEFKTATRIADNVRAAVLKAIDNDYPFVMVAQRPNGEWETSLFFQGRIDDEVVGVLQRVAHRIMVGEGDDET